MRDMILILGAETPSGRAVARKLRAEHYYCRLLPSGAGARDAAAESPAGVILAGEADEGAFAPDADIFSLGLPVLAALAPKTRPDQPGLLYEAHDYALLGAAADYVLLMTYEWGYTYGPPMAVAPLPNVRQVLDYAVTVIPREKIYLGIPNYGYDWPLPFVQGETRARSISNQEAVAIAVANGAEIQFDERAQSPWFRYTREGVEHQVWFEDARSMSAKLRLIQEYGLWGAGYWNLMRPYPQGWTVLNALYRVRDL